MGVGWPRATDPNPVAFAPTSRLQQTLATQLGQSHTIFAKAQGLVRPPNPQYDWPNPLSARERVRNVNLLTHISVDLPIKPPPAPPKPFSQRDWQNPFLPPNRRVWDVDYTYETPLPLPAGATPLKQMDWPNPPPAKRVVDLLTSIYSPLPASATPLSQYDWPLPFPPRANLELRTFFQFPETLKPVSLSIVLNTSDAADTSAFAISIASPVAPSNLVQVQNIQQPGGGGLMPSADAWQFRDYDQVITWKQAEATVEKWYDDGGFRWLEERSVKELRPSERAYLQDSLTQSKDMRFLFNHGYSLQEVYRLIDIVKKRRGDEDDGEAIALLLH